jgi:hypothetical protein
MWSDGVPAGQLMRLERKKAKIPAMPAGRTAEVALALALGALVLECGSSGDRLTGTGGQVCNPNATVQGCA